MGKSATKVLALVGVLIVAGLGFLLLRTWPQSQQGHSGAENHATQASSASSPTIAGHDINDVLALMSDKRQEQAIELFLELVDSDPPPSVLRPVQLSEDQFIRLPRAERERLQEELLATFDQVRALAKEIERRAQDSLAREDRPRAKRLLEGLRQFGAANIGPEVTKLAELVGQAMVNLAEQGLSAINEGSPPAQ